MMSAYNDMLSIFVVNIIPFYCLTGNDYEENKFDADRYRGNCDPKQEIIIIKKSDLKVHSYDDKGTNS